MPLTDEQMDDMLDILHNPNARTALNAAYRLGLLRAAEACEKLWPEMHAYWGPGQARAACEDCAQAIRAEAGE